MPDPINLKDMDKFINVSHIFIIDISRYMAIFSDLKKRTKNLNFVGIHVKDAATFFRCN